MILGWRIVDLIQLAQILFTNRVVNIRNSLPNDVVLCNIINKFKSYLDKFWQYQDTEIHESKVEVHITRTSYIGYQYFISFVFVMQQRQ